MKTLSKPYSRLEPVEKEEILIAGWNLAQIWTFWKYSKEPLLVF